MPISFLDLRRQHEEVGADVRAAVGRVLAGGSYVLGREVEAFEREWARFCGVRACAGVGNGTDALALTLLASGAVRPGRRDEVITTPLTAGYTALAVLNAGGVPAFADVDPKTYTLDPRGLERALTPRTRAVLPVHIYGQMADMEAVCEFAARRGLVVVEDAAQAHGARTGGRRAGGWGHAAAFSFYPTKNLGAYGDGGAVTSDDTHLIERVKELRQGGHPSAFGGRAAGRNSRLDELQAAALRVKLTHLDGWNRRRRQLAGLYRRLLARGVERLVLPSARGGAGSHVFHLYVVRHPERERLRAHLAARGVETLIHYSYALHFQPLFRRRVRPALPTAERLAGEVLSLPLYPQLREDELRAVAEAVLEFKG
ncbi:MAG TPA: DegT/DnrJ/EryC1/StrS family aminotransferase [Pyrinomonadaceae bacterium]|jgi:dTDP-4-amino-4,6-dideoxygalactose transaminase|nr:DegT/DnrJ/EryC1/StrS family aminotransferase [Pyrinomonadaceae bacterium]